MLVIPNYTSKCDIISASGASDVLGWESQEPFSSPASNSVAELEAAAQRLAVGSLQNPWLGREEIQEIAAENGFDQKKCHSKKPGIEINIGTQCVLEDFFRKRETIQNVTNKSWENMGSYKIVFDSIKLETIIIKLQQFDINYCLTLRLNCDININATKAYPELYAYNEYK